MIVSNMTLLLIFSLIYIIGLIILYYSKTRINNLENRVYKFLLWLNMIGIVLQIMCDYVSFYYESVPPLFADAVFKIFVAYFIGWVNTMFDYLLAIIYKQRRYVVWINIVVTLIEVIISLLLPYELYRNVDQKIFYTFGPSVNFTFVISGILMVLMFIFTMFNIKNLEKKKVIPIVLFLVFGGVAAYIQNQEPSLVILVCIETFLCSLMYFTIENPDMKMIAMLDEAKIAAEKANRAKSDFLSNMSHEIRTPLNAIVGFSDCILEETTLEACQTDAKDIKLASENLLEIVNGILDISKIEADKMEIVETDYNPIETFENVAKLVLPRIAEKPIELKTKFAPDVPFMLHGDGGKLRQVITNILTNSAKYTEKGTITFQVNCVNHVDMTTLVISVEDTGRGIKPEQIDRLFKKFERLDEDKNTTLEGTGLGLAITKRFVEMMGGKIVVQSVYGEGSKFTVYINQKIVTSIKPEEHLIKEFNDNNRLNEVDLTQAKVLVVDDNKINIKVALKLLSNYGITADSLDSGVACLEQIKSGKKYDLLLIDDMMPKMSGGETLAELKKLDGYDTPTVVLTANAISGMREQYLSAGFTDYLSKPIDKNELYRVLTTYIKPKKEQVVSMEVSADKPEEKSQTLENKKVYTDFSGMKALIVDDNKINIKIATRMIDDYNFEIDSCLSGSECLDMVKEKDYDIIFMDYMMPDMDGIETLNHLKEMKNFNLPVICLTADAVDGAEEKFLSAGFDAYISKPLDRDKLDKAINNLLSKKDE